MEGEIILMASVIFVHFSMQEEDILDHTLQSTCTPLCNIDIHVIQY